MINFLVAYPLINICVNIVLAMTGLAALINLLNVARGRTLADRVVSLDALGTQSMALIIIYAFKHGTDLYMSAVLVISILSFVALVVWSKYLQKGNITYPLKAFHHQPRRKGAHAEPAAKEGVLQYTETKNAEEKRKEAQKFE